MDWDDTHHVVDTFFSQKTVAGTVEFVCPIAINGMVNYCSGYTLIVVVYYLLTFAFEDMFATSFWVMFDIFMKILSVTIAVSLVPT